MPEFDWERPLADLHELRELTGGPDGARWLDGALGVCAALEVIRGTQGETPPATIKLIDWADEEGARFGRSLLGSSAAAGTLEPDAVRQLTDAEGTKLPDALRENGIDLDTMGDAELPA